jgi:uncharacterized protein
VISVVRLQVVPVKGLAAVPRQQVHLEVDGVAEDRRLLLLRADGAVVTMRKFPELVRVVPDLDVTDGILTVTLPDGTSAASELAAAAEHVTSHLYGRDRPGRVLPGPVAYALSNLAGEPLRLVLTERVGLGWDEGPVSILGRASAAAVATPPDRQDHDALSTARYRMLLEVEGSAPFEEDSWVGRPVRIGQVMVHVTHALERCVVINHHPQTGVKDWPGLKELVARGRDQLTLGVIAQVDQTGVIHVGDAVEPGR